MISKITLANMKTDAASQCHHLATLTMLLSYALSAHIGEAGNKDKVIAISVTASILLQLPTDQLLINPGDKTATPSCLLE